MAVRAVSAVAVVLALLIMATSAGARNHAGLGQLRAVPAGPGQSIATAAKSNDRAAARRRAAARKRAAARRRGAERRAERKRLLQTVRNNPQKVTSSAFVRRAAALGFELPMMLRFQTVLLDSPLTLATPDDLWEVDPGNGAVTPPPFLSGVLAGPQTVTITGVVRFYAVFLDPRIADKPGTLRLRVSAIDLESTPVVLATKECTPGVPVDFLKTGTIDLGMDSVFDSVGVTNLFTGEMELTLNLSLSFNSYRDEDCDGNFDATRRAVTPDTAAGQRPVSLRMVGESRVSPAVTKDGFIRLLLQTVDNSVVAQPAFDQVVNTCTTAPAPPAETCASGDAENEEIRARFKALNISVEALIGH